MEESLMEHVDQEISRLNVSGNLLISAKNSSCHCNSDDNYFGVLAMQFDDLAGKLGFLTEAIIKCNGNIDLLKCCIEYINEMSFMVMNFTVKVMEFVNINKQ